MAAALAAIPVTAAAVGLVVHYSPRARARGLTLLASIERRVPRGNRAGDLLRLFWSRVRRVRPGLWGWLVAFALAVVAALAFWARRAASLLTAVALGLVMGGAVGNNLIDRIRFGAVTDFLDFQPIFPWVFNVADSAISVGVGLLLIEAFARGKQPAAT